MRWMFGLRVPSFEDKCTETLYKLMCLNKAESVVAQ